MAATLAVLLGVEATFVEIRVLVNTDIVGRFRIDGSLTVTGDIVESAHASGLDATAVAKTYFAIGSRFGIDWLRRSAGRLPSDNAWDKLAITAIVDDLYEHQSELTNRVLTESKDAKDKTKIVESQPDFAMLAVANRRLKSLVSR